MTNRSIIDSPTFPDINVASSLRNRSILIPAGKWLYKLVRIALIRGPYLRPDGVIPWEYLHEETDHEVVAFESDPPRFETESLSMPVRQLHWPDGKLDLFGYDYFFSRAIRKLRFPSDYLVGLRTLTDEFDVLHTSENYNLFSLQAALATRKTDTAFTFSAGENIPYPLYQHNPLLWRVKQYVNQTADGITATTPKGMRALIHEGVPHEKVSVVPNAIDTDTFQPAESEVNPATIGFPAECSETINVAFVHGLREQKGTYDLLDAFSRIENRHNLRLLLVGSSDLDSKRAQFVETAKQIHWQERVPYHQMPKLYNLANIVVLPSVTTPNNEEQFGMAILEAMACETATIVTDVGGLPYLVEPGETSLVVNERSPDELQQAIETLVDSTDRRMKMGRQGRERAQKTFHPRVVGQALERFYNTALNES